MAHPISASANNKRPGQSNFPQQNCKQFGGLDS
uniref:Uncharacterized protein n=1 Tax=Rhizophora mucronata TaxID=61149 RepID=A0A2P2PQW4_RHIMU